MKHVHHDSIVAWAADPSQPWEFLSPVHGEWRSVGPKAPSWAEENQYRIKPAAPEYPVSSMSDVQLCSAFEPRPDVMWNSKACRNLADTALRVEFEKGTIITKAEHEVIINDIATKMNFGQTPERRAARDLAIAEAVAHQYNAVISAAASPTRPPLKDGADWIRQHAQTINLAVAIASVKF